MINQDEVFLLTQKIDFSSEMHPSAQALRIAIYDEYRAYETYKAVTMRFGDVKPFSNIVEAESRHISAITHLCEKYSVPPPYNNWVGNVGTADTITENCEIGVSAEIGNIKMYDYLLGFVGEPDIRDVFYRVQAASFNNHLPAFRRCISGTSSQNIGFDGVSKDGLEEKLKGFMQGKFDQKEIEGLMSHLGSDFLVGAVGGAILGAILGGNIFDNKENN